MISKSAIFGSVFLGIDFVFYFLIFFVIGATIKSFPLIESMFYGGESVLWRVIYLQAILQLLLVSVARYYNFHDNILIILVCVIMSFLISSAFFFKDISDFWKFFTFSYELKVVGEGIVMVLSALFAWLVLFKLTKWVGAL